MKKRERMLKKILYAHSHKHFCPASTIIGPGDNDYGREPERTERLMKEAEKEMKKYYRTPAGRKFKKELEKSRKKFEESLKEVHNGHSS